MSLADLGRVAALIAERNAVDAEIAAITGRPVVAGHLGEWIAAQIFDIELETSAVAKALHGRFRSGPLAGRTLNVKWYGKEESLLDVSEDERLHYYLVMTGPRCSAASSRGATRPLLIPSVYLFDAAQLLNELRSRGVKIGVATSVRRAQWDSAEIYPSGRNPALAVTDEQRGLLAQFAGQAEPEPSRAAEADASPRR